MMGWGLLVPLALLCCARSLCVRCGCSTTAECARDVSWVHRVVLYLSEGDPTQSQLISHRVKEAFPRINWDWVHRNVDTTQIRRKMPLPRSGLEHLWPPQPPTAGAPAAAVKPQRSIMRMPPLPALSSHATQALATPSAVACGARKATLMPTTSGRFQGTLAVHRVQHTGVVEVRETVLRLIPARRLCVRNGKGWGSHFEMLTLGSVTFCACRSMVCRHHQSRNCRWGCMWWWLNSHLPSTVSGL